MDNYRALLKLNRPENNNPMRLHFQEYEIIKCEYSFSRETDYKQRIVSKARGGIIKLVLSATPSTELMDWVLDGRIFMNGEISFFDNFMGGNFNKLLFDRARCVRFNFKYDSDSANCLQLNISVFSPKIILNNTEYINPDSY
jgi:hypothetical protein